jgi:hypothetical protein
VNLPGLAAIPEASLVAVLGIVLPGLAGACFPGGSGAPERALRFLLGVTLLNAAAIVVRAALGVPATPVGYAAILVPLAAGAFALGKARGGGIPRVSRGAAYAALAAFLLAAWAGTCVVPPLEDQDMEVQGTAYGIVHELRPICLTNRSTLHFFAHPPLLHVWNAATLTLSGELDDVRASYDAAVQERASLPDEARRPSFARAFAALRDPGERPDRSLRWARSVYPGFLAHPALVGTRAPNFALAALLAALTFAALRRIGAPPADAALLTAAQTTLPEIFVRSAYGGYFAISAVTFLVAAWLAASGEARGKLASGMLAMLANQKSVVIGAASTAAGLRRAMPLLLGLAVGAALFAAWGLSIAPEEFVADHLRDHGFARVAISGGAHDAPRHPGAPTYPSRAGLWLEFARHSGILWTLAVATACGAGLARTVRRRRGGEAAGAAEASGARESPGVEEGDRLLRVALAWTLIGAVLFTWIDWRQTKHLAKLVPAMSLLLGGLAAAAPRPARLALRGAIVLSLVWNAVMIVRLAGDFGSIAPSPMW